jgi:hypothetical protein
MKGRGCEDVGYSLSLLILLDISLIIPALIKTP